MASLSDGAASDHRVSHGSERIWSWGGWIYPVMRLPCSHLINVKHDILCVSSCSHAVSLPHFNHNWQVTSSAAGRTWLFMNVHPGWSTDEVRKSNVLQWNTMFLNCTAVHTFLYMYIIHIVSSYSFFFSNFHLFTHKARQFSFKCMEAALWTSDLHIVTVSSSLSNCKKTSQTNSNEFSIS